MSIIKEYDWLMSAAPDEGIKTYDDGAAMNQRVLEWLKTPIGDIADLPGWGSPLFSFKHEPDSVNLQVMAEMSIFQKLVHDIANIDLRHVSVEFQEIDLIYVVIEHGLGFLEATV